MDLVPCRDCQTMLSPAATGCPECARNIAAERMLARFIWVLVTLAVILVGLFTGAVGLLRE
jgi:hypothetical protein